MGACTVLAAGSRALSRSVATASLPRPLARVPPWLVQSDVVLSEEGVGTFGKVYACKEEGTVDRVVAVKVVRDVERCVWVEP